MSAPTYIPTYRAAARVYLACDCGATISHETERKLSRLAALCGWRTDGTCPACAKHKENDNDSLSDHGV